jgi:hypothetical protein
LIYAYDTAGNGGTYSRKLFIGDPTTNTNSPKIVGGEFFTEMLDHTKGTLTANSAVIVDASSKIDVLNVDNLTLNGNAITLLPTQMEILQLLQTVLVILFLMVKTGLKQMVVQTLF